MTLRIVDVETIDVRFPTSQHLDGSDAMNEAPDYSAAYVVLKTADDAPSGQGAAVSAPGAEPLEGHGFTFTIGRGNDLAVRAARAIGERAIGLSVAEIAGDLGAFSRHLLGDSQLRWLGPDKGAIHLGSAAVINAAWDLAARRAGKPVWKLLADLSPGRWSTWWTGATSRTCSPPRPP
ncbi:hypothetical protein SVIO_014860 [Streptomyces violaceusniger]|uniref:Mandelate racemase/muconate lactonizing enzyme N-terminal domain-containing protein n=1 Tax=Streptomyces violaceusniger TaxID=68280 RepID=A0A4D4KYL9_STRVO|nr:hypothetical protein SVIO_014860 [Streptomyces violaceusniger]